MYNLHLSPEQLEFRDTVREFVEEEVKPVTLKADRLDLSDRTLPVEVLRKASQMGLRTLALPEDLGGVGADALTSCLVTRSEEHTSELQSRLHLVCPLLLLKKKKNATELKLTRARQSDAALESTLGL